MIQVLLLLTIIFSILTVPFASYLCVTFIKERMQSNFIHSELNEALQISTFFIAIGSIISGILSFLLLIGYDFEANLPFIVAQSLFNSRNIVFSLGHFILFAVLTYEHRKIKK